MRPSIPERTKYLEVRLTEAEHQQLKELVSQTLSPSKSSYCRRVLLQKPVIIRTHNESLDQFIADMVQLRKELKNIGDDVNQSVHHLQTLQTLPEIQQWILINEQDKTQLFRIIETISNHIDNAYQLWSRI